MATQYNLVGGAAMNTGLPVGSTPLSRNFPIVDPTQPAKSIGTVQFPDLEPAILQAVQLTLTSAQILALNSTPITLIAAQGAGTIIDVETITAKVVFNSIAYTGANNMEVRFTNGAGAKAAADFGSAFLNSAANAIDQVGGVMTELTPVANAPVVLSVPVANPGAGNSTIVVTAFYRVVTP